MASAVEKSSQKIAHNNCKLSISDIRLKTVDVNVVLGLLHRITEIISFGRQALWHSRVITCARQCWSSLSLLDYIKHYTTQRAVEGY